jgi:RsiW-degrading membrane proteinase PrsW (M82 family)
MATALKARPRPVPPAPASGLRRYLSDVIWAARFTVGMVLLLASRTWPSWWHQMACLLVLALLTYPVRSVRWGTIYNFFIVGMLFAYLIVGVQYGVERGMLGGRFPVLGSVLVAPLTEEIGKALPLVLLVIFGWRGFRISYGACDLMLCGAGLGCGFGLVEDVARHTQSWPTATGPALFGIPIFPDSYGGFLGHGASTAFLALALGCFTYACRRRRWMVPGLVAVLLALLWMMVDHGLSNYATFGGSAGWFAPIRWIWELDGNGRFSPYILFALILVAMLAERVLLWRILRRFPRLKPAVCWAYLWRPLRRGWGYPQLRSVAGRAQTLLLYLLSYRRLGFLLAHWPGDVAPDRRGFAGLISRYTGKVAITQLAVRKS